MKIAETLIQYGRFETMNETMAEFYKNQLNFVGTAFSFDALVAGMLYDASHNNGEVIQHDIFLELIFSDNSVAIIDPENETIYT